MNQKEGMTDIPNDVMLAAYDVASLWYHEEWDPDQYHHQQLVKMIARAILAERERCISLAQFYADAGAAASTVVTVLSGGTHDRS